MKFANKIILVLKNLSQLDSPLLMLNDGPAKRPNEVETKRFYFVKTFMDLF